MPRPPARRLAFVGQAAYFAYTSLQEPAQGVEPRFFEVGGDGLREDLEAWGPDVVFAWRPELVPTGVLQGLPGDPLRLGYLTEPLPRPGEPEHPDLTTRLTYLAQTDTGQFDRFVAFNAAITPAAEQVLPRVWRAFPIPVADSAYADPRPAQGPPRLVFNGRSTAHRERWLGPVKHSFHVVHLAHGVTEQRLAGFLAEADVGLNLHNEDYPQFENRVPALLAAGLLVVTEPLSPRHGLRPGLDLVEVRAPWELWELVRGLARTPDAFAQVRLTGRRTAERFRASRVFPRLVAELEADVAVFGRRAV